MKVRLYVFTGGSRDFADEITSSVHTTLSGAEAAEAEWLADNDESDDDDEDYDGPYHGFVETIDVDITDAEIIR